MVKVSALGFRGERSNTALPIKPDRWAWVCTSVGGRILDSL